MRLLVIDDEPRIGLTLRLLLEEHDVTVATSDGEARERVEAATYDAVLCDLRLKDGSGAELAEWIEARRPELAGRVVMMTGGSVTDAGAGKLRDLPPERWLEKPFSAERIRAVLDRIA